MTKILKLFVILAVILLMFSVILDIHDNLSSVTFQVNHDKTTMTKISVTMTKKDDNFSTMTEKDDKNGFVTFNYIPHGKYTVIMTMPDNTVCEFDISLDHRIQNYIVEYLSDTDPPCQIV